MGADSICIKDMAGLLSPAAASSLVKAIRKKVDLPIQIHSHYTSGMASMTYLAALEAGANVVDCAISPFAMGTSQPATETMVAALAGGPLDTGLSLEKLLPIAKHYQKLREKYKDIIMGVSGVNINILLYQIPGGMYSNLQSQLKEGGCLNKFNEVLEEVPRVRKEMGYPPLVTPTSQIVGTQAAMNVISGKRWKMIPNEVRQYFRGYYGKTPAPVPARNRAGEERNRRMVHPARRRPLLHPLPAGREGFPPREIREGKLRRPRKRAAGSARGIRDITKALTLPQK